MPLVNGSQWQITIFIFTEYKMPSNFEKHHFMCSTKIICLTVTVSHKDASFEKF